MPNAVTIDPATWNDSQSPALSARVGGTAPAFAAILGGIYGLHFGANEEVHTSVQFSHGYAAGTSFRPHVHFLFPSVPTAGHSVIWGMEYSFSGVNGMFSAAATVAFDTYLATAEDAGAARPYHRVVGIAEVSAPTFSESGIILARIFRSGGTSTVEPALLSWDVHYQSVKRGTIAEYPA